MARMPQLTRRRCIHSGDGFTYSNREQDLDDPGLRKAKESYNPVDYVRKQKARVL